MREEERNIEFRNRVVRYLSGEMDARGRSKFEDELESDSKKHKQFREYLRLWDGIDQLAERTKYDLDLEWEMLSDKMDLTVESQVRHKVYSRGIFLRLAAVLVIGLAGLAGWWLIDRYAGYESISVDTGTEVVVLPDGSTVTLNAGSSLRYPSGNRSPQRKVFLSGEAFFEITYDTVRPFTVEASQAIVKVLGTSFNINAYRDNETVEVTVSSGRVSMASKSSLQNQLILHPGNAGVLKRKAGKLELIPQADPNNAAWKTRELVFSNTPLPEVIRVINHVYQSELVIGNPAIEKCTLTVTFSQQEFSSVLTVLVTTFDLNLERRDGLIVLTGSGCQ